MNKKNAIKLNFAIICLLSFFMTNCIYAQEKIDNAAILYYQAFLLCPEDSDTFSDEFIDFGFWNSDSIPDNLQFKIKSYSNLIQLFTKASEIQECNWLINDIETLDDISKQISLRRTNLIAIIGADARNSAINGDYIAAFNKYRTLLQFSKNYDPIFKFHNLISPTYIVALKCIGKVLDIMPSDENDILYIKNLLANEQEYREHLLKKSIYKDLEYMMEQLSEIDIKKELKDQPIKDPNYENYKKELLSMDNEDIVKIINHDIENFLDSVFETIQKNDSYSIIYPKIQVLQKEFEQQFIDRNPAINLGIEESIKSFALTIDYMYYLHIKVLSQFNAFRAAVDIYLVKARTGQLPKELPRGLSKDPFSGKDFEYTLIDNGFKLRCQENDIVDDKFDEYEFKVK